MAHPKNLADILFPIESDNEQEILNIPPEKRRLHTDTLDFTISTINDYLVTQHIRIPSFQRGYVWNRAQASRLIESLIIQCPIPIIYLAQQYDEKLAVVDGNQRLSSIKLFLNDEFELQGLTTYPELEGSTFSSLDPRFQRHILNRTLRCIVILKETHPQIKFDVFERLNTGSVKLNAQELRHGIYQGKFIELFDEIASDKKIQKIVGIKDNKRMKIQESILRFYAYYDHFEDYTAPQISFLNTYAEKKRFADEKEIKSYKNLFYDTLEKVQNVFGNDAFKMFDLDGNIISSFNSALFDAQMVSVAKSTKTISPLTQSNRDKIKADLCILLNKPDLKKTLTQATTNESALKFRINAFMDFINAI